MEIVSPALRRGNTRNYIPERPKGLLRETAPEASVERLAESQHRETHERRTDRE